MWLDDMCEAASSQAREALLLSFESARDIVYRWDR